MYFYNSLLLISNILIFTIYTQSQISKGRGISGCTFLGYANKECGSGTADVKIDDIPEECSFILYHGIYADLNYNFFADPTSDDRNQLILDNLDEILQSGKQIYVYYGHAHQSEWSQMLANETRNGGANSNREVNGLKVFMDKHKGITGLILTALEYDCNSVAFPDYSENLKKYLEVMKTHFPRLEISIQIEGDFLIDQINNPKFPWLDFKVINPVVDFYIISLMHLNACNPELINTGAAPMSSSCSTESMINVANALMETCIPKHKKYFGFRLNPDYDIDDLNTRCNSTIQSFCVDKTGTSGFGSDTLASLKEKGQYVRTNGVGFITSYIDFNDPKNLCKCEKPFPSFYALLDGYTFAPLKPCDLFP